MFPEEPNTNFSKPQILGDENKIREKESLACFVSSVGVSKRGLLAIKLMSAMRTEVVCEGKLLLKMSGEKLFWGGIEFFKFLRGGTDPG